jgi:glutamate--cysteine ligase
MQHGSLHNPGTTGLASYILDGCKQKTEWRTGVEVEIFGFTCPSLDRLRFRKLEEIISDFDGASEHENGRIIGASGLIGALSLEPGGQLEFSGRPVASLSQLERDLHTFFSWLASASHNVRATFIAIGFDPLSSLAVQRWVPKQRYEIMRPYLAKQGARAWDMMSRTAAVQCSIDFESAEDAGRKFIAGNRLAPIATAIFANSPLKEGRLSGYKSERAAAWLETDPDRCGISPAVEGRSFSIERFIDYAVSVPMFFARRDGQYVNLAGVPFSTFLSGGSDLPEPQPNDFADHLTTIFTEARLKQVVELRSTDCGGIEQMLAIQAFWKGLLYHEATLDDALQLAPNLDMAEFFELQTEVARHGLAARTGAINVLARAKGLIELAVEGLKATAPDELRYLEPVRERVISEELCPADILIRNFKGSWHGQIGKVIEYLRIT